jgi:hypothetical protein
VAHGEQRCLAVTKGQPAKELEQLQICNIEKYQSGFATPREVEVQATSIFGGKSKTSSSPILTKT